MNIIKLLFAVTALNFATAPLFAEDIPLADLKKGVLSGFGQLPQQLDEATRLDKIEVGHMEVVYYYTLVNFSFDQLSFPALKEALRPNINATYCVGDTMKGFRDNGISMLYLYYDKNQELFGTIKTDKSVCAK